MNLLCVTDQEVLIVRYKDRFIASLPASRRASADFTRPVFTAVAFYLCAKRHKVIKKRSYQMLIGDCIVLVFYLARVTNVLTSQLKIDKLKLIEVCGTSESEFKSVRNTLSLHAQIFDVANCNFLPHPLLLPRFFFYVMY